MNHSSIVDSVQEFIRQGDTGQAIQVFITYLKDSGLSAELLRSLYLIEANFNAAKRKENNGVLNFSEARSEYAKINEAILSSLDALTTGKYQSSGPQPTAKNRRVWIIAGLVLVGLGVVLTSLFVKFKAGYQPQQPEKTVQEDCPKFRPEGFKVMVLEFQKLSGEDSKPELGIQTRIRDLTERNQLDTDVRILGAKAFDGTTPGNREATDLGKQCQADMVIWGQYEKTGDSLAVDIRYAFTDPNWPPGAALETFKNVTEIKAGQMKTSSLDEAVFRLCTNMALRQNRVDLAKKWLNKIQSPNALEQSWRATMNDEL